MTRGEANGPICVAKEDLLFHVVDGGEYSLESLDREGVVRLIDRDVG